MGAEEVLHECKETAAKRRRQSTRLENLGIPEEELLRQQQELFAKARQAAVQSCQLSQAAVQQPAQVSVIVSTGGERAAAAAELPAVASSCSAAGASVSHCVDRWRTSSCGSCVA